MKLIKATAVITQSILGVTLAISTSNLLAAEVCITSASDPDGDGWGWEQEASCTISPGFTDAGPTPVFDPRSGDPINLQRIEWQLSDFTGQVLTGCNGYVVDPTEPEDQCVTCESDELYSYEHYQDGNGRFTYSNGAINIEAQFDWGVDEFGFYHGPMPVNAFAEVTDSGIKQWAEGTPGSIGFYEQCDGLVPTRLHDAYALLPGVVVPGGIPSEDNPAPNTSDPDSDSIDPDVTPTNNNPDSDNTTTEPDADNITGDPDSTSTTLDSDSATNNDSDTDNTTGDPDTTTNNPDADNNTNDAVNITDTSDSTNNAIDTDSDNTSSNSETDTTNNPDIQTLTNEPALDNNDTAEQTLQSS